MTRRRQRGNRPAANRRGPDQAATSAAPMLVEIEKPIYGGAFLARAEGKAIFAPLTLPGEQARVRLVDEKRGYAFAEPEEIVSEAAERVTPRCPHFGACGGCDYQHAKYEAQLGYKQAILRETLERGGIRAPEQIEVVAAEPWAYRNRIRLAFDAAGNVGYRGRRSHAILAIRECPISAPLLVDAAKAIERYFRNVEHAKRPAEISLFCDADESALLVSVITANAAKASADDLACVLGERVAALRGIEFVTQGLPGRQPRTAARWGERSIAYRAAGFDYRVDQGAFFQVNRWLVDALVERVTAGRSGKLAWDLFAGVGLFARQLAGKFERVIAVESATAAIPALEANLQGTAGEAAQAGVDDFLESNRDAERPDLVVVDPPRTGLGPEIVRRLGDIAPVNLTYVSCDPATLARDVRSLAEKGYRIKRTTLFDLFPQTFHLETVVDLVRA